MKQILWFIYNKWIIRQCPHICLLCKYKDEMYKSCKSDMEKKLYINK